jgi:hypothetical protein
MDLTSEDEVLSRSSAVQTPRGAGIDGELQDGIGIGCSVSYGGMRGVGKGVRAAAAVRQVVQPHAAWDVVGTVQPHSRFSIDRG